ncbi:conjugal transfer protein TraH [Neorhizobium sp. NCHU2750]|uniref:conjugal transfer protein TraH n=1 Tax=Neorhizobium sp. NCHU2750 TaxID=1825976 RepID=UPI000E743B88|nr:conjugal transfer protein [Neorhizobium sp. NCHU2750]
MLDAALIAHCADPSLTPAIVEQFVEAAGSDDPLAITVRWGDKKILLTKPATTEEALEIVRQNAVMATVRVGITQLPVGYGVGKVEQLDGKLLDACDNLRTGTAMFAKIARIVTRWYGNPTDKAVLTQLFDDAVVAWRTGVFRNQKVFSAADPGGQTFLVVEPSEKIDPQHDNARLSPDHPNVGENAEIRVDLSHIGIDP